MNHRPFRVRTPLITSIRLGRFPVSLDGLLWHCLFLKTGDPVIALDRLENILSRQDGVFRASTLRFGVYANAPLIATQTPIVGAMRQGTDLLSEQFHPTGRGEKYTRLVVGGGPFKDRLTKYDTYHAPELTWDGQGDPQAVCELLNFYVIAVGLEANRGFGSVGNFWWEPLSEDTSWIDEDQAAARMLPVPLWESMVGPAKAGTEHVMAQISPPYRQGADTLCVAPPRVRRIRLQAPI